MSEAHSNGYGWVSSQPLTSASYLNPTLFRILDNYGVRNVLDLGCGNGALAYSLSELGYKVAGVEYDYEGCLIAREAFPSIPFFNLGVQDDISPDLASLTPFDAVISTEVIEHLFAPHLLPRFASRILKQRGILVISTPYHGYLKNLIISLLNKWDSHHTPLWHGGHIKFWSRKSLTSLLEANGFDVVSFHGAGRTPFLWKSMIIVARPSVSCSHV